LLVHFLYNFEVDCQYHFHTGRVVKQVLRIVTLGLIAFAAAPAGNAADASKLPGGTWASIAQLPDLNGVWEMTFGARRAAQSSATRGAGDFGPPQQFVLTPAYAAMQKEYMANPPHDSPMANCVPPGMPGVMSQPYPIEILYTPGMVTVIAEAFMQVRHIYTDGRAHPDDPDLTYNGHSIGHWEGDTLVVDTVGFTKDTPLGMNMGVKHSEKMHIVERFHLADPKTLEIATTISDPEALSKPWSRTITYARHPDWTLAEYICQQNNRNFVDASGKAGINLTVPKQ
jgi:hypothetical protein